MKKITAINKRHLQDLFVEAYDQNISDLNHIDTSLITDMSHLFLFREDFDIDITGWDVSNVTNMNHMFSDCTNFNRDISHWDV